MYSLAPGQNKDLTKISVSITLLIWNSAHCSYLRSTIIFAYLSLTMVRNAFNWLWEVSLVAAAQDLKRTLLRSFELWFWVGCLWVENPDPSACGTGLWVQLSIFLQKSGGKNALSFSGLPREREGYQNLSVCSQWKGVFCCPPTSIFEYIIYLILLPIL